MGRVSAVTDRKEGIDVFTHICSPEEAAAMVAYNRRHLPITYAIIRGKEPVYGVFIS